MLVHSIIVTVLSKRRVVFGALIVEIEEKAGLV